MTLLNWELAPDQVVIFSDTLSLQGHTKLPRSFMTKIYPVPHLNGIVTGTGIGQIVTSLFVALNDSMVVIDTVHLTKFAPAFLRDLWEQYEDELPDGATTTIYTFGLNDDGQFVGFAYRSTNDFTAEPLPYARGLKPAPTKEQMAGIETLGQLGGLAFQQQSDDRTRPRVERIGIGGDLWLYVLSKSEDGSLGLTISRAARLPHFEADYELMLAQLSSNAGNEVLAALLDEAMET